MEQAFVSGAGVELAWWSAGDGDPTVVVHGMGAEPVTGGRPGRVIAYDRRGYGNSEAPEPYSRTTVSEQAEDLAALVTHLDIGPALLVGHDLGALAVLDVLFRHPELASGAVLVDPPAYMFVAEATEALSEERAALEDAVRNGGPQAGMAWWLEERDRPGRSGLRDALAFFADYGALASLEISHTLLDGIDVPVEIEVSDGAPMHDVAAAAALRRALG